MDEIERKIRTARPLSGDRDMPLTPRAKQELHELLATEAAHESGPYAAENRNTRTSRSGHKVSFWGRTGTVVAAAIVLLLVVGVAFQLFPGQSHHAQAATPPILDITPVEGSTEQWLEQLSQAAAVRGHDEPTPDNVDSESWSLSMEIREDGEVYVHHVVPERSTYMYHPDGSVSLEVRAGEPFSEDQPEGEDIELPPEGTLLVDETAEPGEISRLRPQPIPDESSEIEEYLTAPLDDLPPSLDGDQTLSETAGLLNEWSPTGSQEAAVLSHLATLDDLQILGEVTDRLGRPGIAFAAEETPENEHQYLLVVSDEGRILSIELRYTGTSRDYLEPPSVIEYTAWT